MKNTVIKLEKKQPQLLKEILRAEFDKASSDRAIDIIQLAKSLRLDELAEEMQADLEFEKEINNCKTK